MLNGAKVGQFCTMQKVGKTFWACKMDQQISGNLTSTSRFQSVHSDDRRSRRERELFEALAGQASQDIGSARAAATGMMDAAHDE